MIQVFPASSRYSADHGWLQSNFSFSFADYHDPNNTSFGPLRVLNDDIVEGHRGFGAHPHKEMEVVSIVLDGELKHQDSTGHSAVTTYGGVQRMSAGTGIVHSETNPGDTPVNFLQLWFYPAQSGLEPSYETTNYDPAQMKNELLPIVSSQSGPQVAHIHQDLTIYLSELDAKREVVFEQPAGRRVFVMVLEGRLAVNGETTLGQRDSARITDVTSLRLTAADEGSRFMLIDLP